MILLPPDAGSAAHDPRGAAATERAHLAAAAIVEGLRAGEFARVTAIAAEERDRLPRDAERTEAVALAELWTALAEAAVFEGRLRDAVAHVYRALGIRGASAATRQCARALLAGALALGGDDDAAQAVTVAAPGRSRVVGRYPLFALGVRDGLVAAAALDGPQLVAVGERIAARGGAWERAVGAALNGLAALVAGQPAEAIRRCAPVLGTLDGVRLPPLLRSMVSEVLALAHVLRGDPARAVTAVAGDGRDDGHFACVPGVEGVARLALGDPSGALRATDGCLHLGSDHSLRTLARPLLVRAIAFTRLGDERRAALAAEEAAAVMTRGIRPSLLPALGLDPREVDAVLAAARVAPGALRTAVAALPRPAAVADGPMPALTRRESVIAVLLRGPLTLAEIGAHLSVSTNTVKSQVRQVYVKLGVGSRTEAVERLERIGFYAFERGE